MERKTARANAMKLIYEWEMGGEGGDDTVIGMLEAKADGKDDGSVFMNSVFFGVTQNAEMLDAEISKYLRNWKIDRLSRVDLAILRMGAWELMNTDNPAGVVINEAVELANTYSEDRAGAFVNGVLGSLSRNLIK